MSQSDELDAILAEAQSSGNMEEPSQLLHALRTADLNIASFASATDVDKFATVFIEQFGYLHSDIGQLPLALNRRAKWVALLRWIFFELEIWRIETDIKGQKLAAIFIILQSVRRSRQIDTTMSAIVSRNVHLIKLLQAFIKTLKIEFSSQIGVNAPIWELEALKKFEAADYAADWKSVGESLHLFERQFISFDIVFNHSVRLLAGNELKNLVEAVSEVNQTLVALRVSNIIGCHAAILLANTSENAYIQFACVYSAVSRRGLADPLTGKDQVELSSLLSRVSRDRDRWAAWMSVFNTHPVRYPELQRPLGRALAVSDNESMQVYVETIELHPWPTNQGYGDGRRVVSDCLDAFRSVASLSRRQFLWSRIYERWSEWNFAVADNRQHIFNISWSELDFAIVGFAVECLDEGGRNREVNEIRHELQNLDLRWHDSISNISTAWNRLCSRFQPFAHAIKCGENHSDWLFVNQIYLPFDPKVDLYIKEKFKVQ